MTAIDVSSPRRSGSRALATRLLWLTLAWNVFEGSLGVTFGLLAGSVALLGFSFDSLIEVSAAAILLWRLSLPAADQRGEQREQIAHRIVGATFIALAIYIVIQAAYTITTRNNPEASSLGLLLATSSLLVQPALGIGKLRNARALASRALIAESKETLVCLSLSVILFVGLAANLLFGWWWADTGAALAMTPWIIKEGLEGIRGEACDDDC